jgi:hypothetical protein
MSVIEQIFTKFTEDIKEPFDTAVGSVVSVVAKELKVSEARVKKALDASSDSKEDSKKSAKDSKTSKTSKPAAKTVSKGKGKSGDADLTIVTGYGTKNHALIGEKTKDIKDKLSKLKAKYNGGLAPSPGWVFPFDLLDDVKALLDEEEITYHEITKKENDDRDEVKAFREKAKAAKSTKKASSDEDDEDEKPAKGAKGKGKAGKGAAKAGKGKGKGAAAKGKSKATKPAPKGKGKATDDALVLETNEWDNYEEPDSGIVFVELPIGPGNKKIRVAVGTQSTDSEKKGLDSLFALTETDLETCKENKWRALDDETFKLVKDKKLAAALAEVRERKPDEEEEKEEGEGEDEGEEEDAFEEEEPKEEDE